MTDTLVKIKNLKYSYNKKSLFEMTVKNFSLNKGERLLIHGESGLGKSTFLNLISGSIEAKIGDIEILGNNISNIPGFVKDEIRGNHFGIVFQTFNLLPYISVENNILLGLIFSKRKRSKIENIKKEIKVLMQNLSLNYDELKDRKSYQLSIGQQQRVAVARALIGRPEIILADEPTSALDLDNQKIFLDLLFRSLDKDKQGLIMVSHNKDVSKNFSQVKNIKDICELKNV